MQGFGIHS